MRLPPVAIRGGGDLGSGVAHRLHRAGFPVVILELARPRMIRRTVCFAEAVYRGEWTVEGVRARLVDEPGGDDLPVLVDPEGRWLDRARPHVLVDARMLKRPPERGLDQAPVVIGLGPGFTAGEDAHYVVETHRGHELGRVIDRGPALPDTGVPGKLGGEDARRVVKAPVDGVFRTERQVGDLVQDGDALGFLGETPVAARLAGLLRGLMHDGMEVRQGEKIADVDPRGAGIDIHTISDKSRAIGGGVLEAVMHALVGRRRSS